MTNIFNRKEDNRKEEKRNAKLSKAHKISKTHFRDGVLRIKNFTENK
jgi:hypothetical protein